MHFNHGVWCSEYEYKKVFSLLGCIFVVLLPHFYSYFQKRNLLTFYRGVHYSIRSMFTCYRDFFTYFLIDFHALWPGRGIQYRPPKTGFPPTLDSPVQLHAVKTDKFSCWLCTSFIHYKFNAQENTSTNNLTNISHVGVISWNSAVSA